MIPKNKRRLIKVNGREFEYCIKGIYDEDSDRQTKETFIRNIHTGKSIKYRDDIRGEMEVAPLVIRRIILENWGNL